ncbi:MAG: hypothetical protein CO073_00145, partial [Candidatus Komeilibacteria bacterium CG_4_9_14_0_8_um_filter_36_9]
VGISYALIISLIISKCCTYLLNWGWADNKINQLLVARNCGLSIPVSFITNIDSKARDFIGSKSSIFKTLKFPIVDFGNKGVGMINTSLIERSMIDPICANISITANFFQKYVDKLYELRIHVIGTDIIAVKIESQENSEAIVDWRLADFNDLDYEEVDLPDVVRKSILKFMSIMGLNFGILDMIVTKDQEYIFLELNPNGNWV